MLCLCIKTDLRMILVSKIVVMIGVMIVVSLAILGMTLGMTLGVTLGVILVVKTTDVIREIVFHSKILPLIKTVIK